MRNSFFLVIPEQKKAPETAQTYEENQLTQWTNELPAANPSLSTRMLLDLLTDMNKVDFPAPQRLDALEIVRPHFLQIEDLLRSRLIKTGFPKTSNEHKIMSVLDNLEKQLCLGYWICVKQLSQKNLSWFQTKQLSTALQRTVRGLNSIVLTHFIINKPVPEWIWIDLHSLYKLSKKLKKETTKIADDSNLSKKSSVEDCYKQILLLSLADPSALMPREFAICYHFIEKMIPLISLEEQPVSGQKKQCLVQTDEDIPPFFSDESTNDMPDIWYVNLTRLLKSCQDAKKYVDPDQHRYNPGNQDVMQQTKLPVSLFKLLLAGWQGNLIETSPLFPDRINRYIAIGLDITHEIQMANINTKSPLHGEQIAESFSENSLVMEFERPNALSIGSLISFRRIDQGSLQRTLAVVSRLRLAKQDNKLIFEPQFISQQVFAATYLPLNADADTQRQKALLYAVKTETGEKTFIIIDSFFYKRGDLLRLFFNNENFPIILNHRTNIGLGYWQFECGRLEEKQISQVREKKKKGFDFI